MVDGCGCGCVVLHDFGDFLRGKSGILKSCCPENFPELVMTTSGFRFLLFWWGGLWVCFEDGAL